MIKSLLSIIIPVFNTADYLTQTLKVLSNQCYKNIEIVIVNDNSTDNIDEVIDEYLRYSNNLIYIKNEETLGAGLSRNRGMEVSQGEFLTFLDGDDWIDLACYKTAIERIQQDNNFDIAVWGIKNEYENSASSYIRTNYSDYNEIDKNIALSLLCNTFSIDVKLSSYLGSKIFRRSLIFDNRIAFGDYLFEDIEFTCKAIEKSRKIILLPEIFTHYRQREMSIIHTFSEKHINDTFRVLRNVRSIICTAEKNSKADYNALVEKSCKNILNFLFTNVSNPNEQRKYLKLFFKCLLEFTSINEMIDYLDIIRIKRLLLSI